VWLEPARRPKLDCRLVRQVYSQTDASNDEIKMEKPNPGLKGRLNPGFRFEKSPGYPGSVKPGLQTLCSTLSTNLRRDAHKVRAVRESTYIRDI